jgi:hypothetical protein
MSKMTKNRPHRPSDWCRSKIRFIGVTFRCEMVKGHLGPHMKEDEPGIWVYWKKFLRR